MSDKKKMFCTKYSGAMACKNTTLIESRSPHIIYLSLLRLHDASSIEKPMEIYVKMRKYEMLKKNYDSLSDEDLSDLIKALNMIFDKLPHDQKDFFLDKANRILRAKGMNIDLLNGLSMEDGITFFIDANKEMMRYIKSVLE